MEAASQYCRYRQLWSFLLGWLQASFCTSWLCFCSIPPAFLEKATPPPLPSSHFFVLTDVLHFFPEYWLHISITPWLEWMNTVNVIIAMVKWIVIYFHSKEIPNKLFRFLISKRMLLAIRYKITRALGKGWITQTIW